MSSLRSIVSLDHACPAPRPLPPAPVAAAAPQTPMTRVLVAGAGLGTAAMALTTTGDLSTTYYACVQQSSGGTIPDALRAQTRVTWPTESRLLTTHLPLRAGARVADICCGIGDFAAQLHDDVPGLEITAVDWSASAIAMAREHRGARAIDHITADATRLPLPDDHFDVVLCRHALQTMPTDVRAAVIAELVRICRPGGAVYITNEKISLCYGSPEDERIAEGYAAAAEAWRLSGADIECGPRQSSWLREAGLADVKTVPWTVSSDADPAGFVALVDRWEPLYLAMAADAGLDELALQRITRGFAAHRRAAMAGHAGWPLWSSFGRKPGA